MTARSLRRAHLTLAGAWAVLSIPTILWWKQSILWVALMSVYAIVVAHLAAYDAARAEED